MRSLMLASILFMLGCGAARAPVARFEELPARLEPGKQVIVDDASGQQRRGALVQVTPDRIIFSEKGIQTTLNSTDVRRVAFCCDSLANGAAIGLGIGVVAGFFVLGSIANPFTVTTDQAIWGLVIGGGLGAAAGAGVDAAAHTDEIVYLARGVTVTLDRYAARNANLVLVAPRPQSGPAARSAARNAGTPLRPTLQLSLRW